ncbi:hypothetical protein BOTCAL_0545g00020 [Botryotinia calthae]|uniref:Uncharacterized protein n=1 Tax=Botryotinia calthae TaxID=38488 RepID=A0A4Y8CKW8_9HELO|nr:hypothetical protein BOTCAL_0545g00020 [Botryotinia calthae]
MTDTIMQDTIMQDTIMQDADTQDLEIQDTVMQDTGMPDVERKIAKMKTPRQYGQENSIREDLWKPNECFYLLHLYTINDNNISMNEGRFFSGQKGVVATLIRDMTAESVKHYPGGLLLASDPWFPRTYTDNKIYSKVRKLLKAEDDLAAELETKLNAHYGIDSDSTAQQTANERQIRALERQSRRAKKKLENQLANELKKQKAILRKNEIQEEKRLQETNQALRLAFAKVKKPVIIDSTDA